jgi:hypothetical protein
MSGAVRQVKKLFSSDETKQAIATKSQRQTEADAPARMASPEERALALRRRRGSRSLLSEERMNAESGLGGDQTMLGG